MLQWTESLGILCEPSPGRLWLFLPVTQGKSWAYHMGSQSRPMASMWKLVGDAKGEQVLRIFSEFQKGKWASGGGSHGRELGSGATLPVWVSERRAGFVTGKLA